MITKHTFIIGFMLFAIFFGAGNLIFPPKLGYEMGSQFPLAMTGFILTGVGLPLLTIIIGAFFHDGYKQALNNINPFFSFFFLVAVYLALGPGFGIPRTAATAYDMAIAPLLDEQNSTALLIFTAIYFFIAIWFALNPSKMVGRVGAILTPILLLLILALVGRSIMLFSQADTLSFNAPVNPFTKGIVEGYFTMDILAAMAFSVIVISAVKAQGLAGKAFRQQTMLAGIIAAILLISVYVAIGWIGSKMPPEITALSAEKGQHIGTFILNYATHELFGTYGQSILGITVILACLTTAVGLISSISQYFSQVLTFLSYRQYVMLFGVVSFILANRGLDAVINTSVPVLLILYPISITLLVVLLAQRLINMPLVVQRCAIGFVSVISVISVLGEKWGITAVSCLPFKADAMEWIPFALLGIFIGYIIYACQVRKGGIER